MTKRETKPGHVFVEDRCLHLHPRAETLGWLGSRTTRIFSSGPCFVTFPGALWRNDDRERKTCIRALVYIESPYHKRDQDYSLPEVLNSETTSMTRRLDPFLSLFPSPSSYLLFPQPTNSLPEIHHAQIYHPSNLFPRLLPST